MDEAAKKAVLRSFTYGLYVVTLNAGGQVHGFTANWLTQAAFEPPSLVMAVENDSRSLEMLRVNPVFAVNVLESGQRELAGTFGRSSKKVADKMQGIAYHTGVTGCPLLTAALGSLECDATILQECGDHTLVIGRVIEAALQREAQPLTMSETGFRYFG